MGKTKTTVEIQDELLARAKQHAQRNGRSLRNVIEDGLRQVLSAQPAHDSYVLADHSVGDEAEKDPLEAYSWQDLRAVIYPHTGA